MDTQQHHELLRRLDKLEHQNRKLRWLFLLVPLVVAMPFVLAAAPSPKDEKIAKARSFQVVDDDNRVRAELSAKKEGTQLILYNAKGAGKMVELAATTKDGSLLRLYDAKGNARVVTLGDLEGTGPTLALLGEEGEHWFLVSAYTPVFFGEIGSSGKTEIKPADPILWLSDRKGGLSAKFYKGWMGR